ncbi:hypothetical protein ACNS7O_11970 [Haloferacaceae archaeon DSL9]
MLTAREDEEPSEVASMVSADRSGATRHLLIINETTRSRALSLSLRDDGGTGLFDETIGLDGEAKTVVEGVVTRQGSYQLNAALGSRSVGSMRWRVDSEVCDALVVIGEDGVLSVTTVDAT